MKILWIFFWGHHKIRVSLRVISLQFRVSFFKVKVQNWYIFLGRYKYFFGVLEIPDIFCGER